MNIKIVINTTDLTALSTDSEVVVTELKQEGNFITVEVSKPDPTSSTITQGV
jgi:hypothetical protein